MCSFPSLLFCYYAVLLFLPFSDKRGHQLLEKLQALCSGLSRSRFLQQCWSSPVLACPCSPLSSPLLSLAPHRRIQPEEGDGFHLFLQLIPGRPWATSGVQWARGLRWALAHRLRVLRLLGKVHVAAQQRYLSQGELLGKPGVQEQPERLVGARGAALYGVPALCCHGVQAQGEGVELGGCALCCGAEGVTAAEQLPSVLPQHHVPVPAVTLRARVAVPVLGCHSLHPPTSGHRPPRVSDPPGTVTSCSLCGSRLSFQGSVSILTGSQAGKTTMVRVEVYDTVNKSFFGIRGGNRILLGDFSWCLGVLLASGVWAWWD